MFRSKQDVDRHVRNILDRIKDDKEKTSRGYQIARLYYEIGDYETSKRYLTNFLNLRENVPQAHKLLGQIYEATNQKEKAIQSFRRSIELDSNQQDLVAKVGNLFINPRVNKVERGKDKDVDNNIKSIRQLIAEKKTQQAYHIIREVESEQLYPSSSKWYEYIVDALHNIRKAIENDEIELMIYHLMSLLRLSYLQLSAHEDDKFNQTIYLLNEVLWMAENIPEKRPEWKILLEEIQAQFFYFAGIFLLKRAFSKIIPWKEIVPLVSMCYLTSCSYTCIKQMVNWSNLIKKDNKIFTNLFDFSNYRLTQAGHMLQVIDKSTATKPVLHYMHQLTATPWRKLLFECLFPSRRSAVDRESFILSSKNISHRSLVIPNSSDIFRNDEVACHVYPDRLAEIVWIVLQKFPNGDIQSDYRLNLFPKLKYSVPDLNIVSVESLCQLDIECFLYATVRCSSIKLHDDKSNNKPFLCPPSIDDSLCTMEQVEWWKFAFCFCVNSNITDFGKMRRTLQRGLEIVRAADNHGMSIHMLVHLAQCMEVKVKDIERTDYTSSQISAIRDRAYHFWYNALLLVEQIESCGSLTVASYKHLFNDDYNKTLDSNVLLKLKEEIKLAVAKRLKEDGMYEMALDYFKSVPSPWASYYSSQIYRQLGEKESGSVEQRKSYLENSLNALHLTLDRLQGDKNHELNQYLFPFMNEVELLIKQTDTDTDLEEDTNNSRYHTPQGKVDNNPNHQVYHNTSTPSNPVSSSSRRLDMSTQVQVPNPNEHHLQPSPERLDSQIRQLSHSQESLLNVVLKRNEDLVKTNLELVAGLKECMETIRELKFEMYHRSAILGGLSSAATPRSFSTIASPYPAEVLANEMMSPGYFLDQSKPGAHLITTPQHITREIPINPNQYYEENFVPPMDHNSIHMSHRRLPPNVGFNESHISHPGPHDESSVLSKLPGPGFFSPVSIINSASHYDASKKLPLSANNLQSPVPKSNVPDSLASINILFCGKVSYCNQENVILKMISIGNLTQIVIESVSHQSTTESYNVKDIYLQSSMSPKVVTCFYRSAGQQDKILNWNFDSSEKANEFKQSLTTAISHIRAVGVSSNTTSDMPSTTQTVSQSTGFSWNTFSPSASKDQEKKTVSQSPHVNQSPTVNQTGEISKTVEANNSLEDFEPNVHFKPVIDLPDLVALTTGEESEIKIYSDRAKLYRYDSQSSQWKERGVGVFKILKSQDTNKFRFLMRRDQVLKICANHLLTKEMKLSPMTNSDKAWCWVAEDFADEEMKPEQFALRLKNKEMAYKFKEEFEKCQKELETNEVSVKSKDIEQPTKPSNKTEVVPLSDVFKAKADTWECSGCLCRNESKVKICPACTTPKPGEKSASAQKVDIDSSKFSFGSGGGFSVQTQPTKESSFFSTTTKNTAGGFSFQQKIDTKVPAGEFSFQPKSDLKEAVGGFSFQQTTGSKAPAGGFSFQQDSDSNATTGGFSFQPKPNTTKKDVSVDNKKVEVPSSNQTKSVPLSDVFKAKTDTWECSGCLCRNENTVKICPACTTPKPGEKAAPAPKVDLASSKFSFGSGGGFSVDCKKVEAPSSNQTKSVPLSDVFKAKTDTWECSGCLCRNENTVKICPACTTPKPGEESAPVPKVDLDSSKFSFGSGGGFSVQTQPTKESPFIPTDTKNTLKPASVPGIANVAKPFTFGSAGGFSFTQKTDSKEPSGGFSFQPATDSKVTAGGFSFQATTGSKETVSGTSQAFENIFSPVSSTDGEKMQALGSKTQPVPLSEVFKPKTDRWECNGCLCQNENTVKICPACSTPKPGEKPTPSVSASKFQLDSSKFSFGSGGGFAVQTQPTKDSPFLQTESKDAAKSQTIKNVFGTETCDAAQKFRDEFKDLGTDKKKEAVKGFEKSPTSVSKPQPVFGSTDQFVFGSTNKFGAKPETPAQEACPTESKEVPKTSIFQNPFGSSGFTFSLKPTELKEPSVAASPAKNISKAAADSTEAVTNEDMYINKEGDDSHIVFEPIIPLPEKVEVKTMEEDEDVLFNNRAKLYRFVDGEWKEKGLGVMKILEHKQTGSRRIVMRRDQVHKVCCNHRITPDLVIKPMIKSEGKALVWFAVDFSDEEEKVEQLSARFKTAEIAANFQALFEESKEKATANASITKGSPSKDVTKAAADSTVTATNEDMYINKEGDDSHIVFEPIIPLPEKVEVKTMEEDEDELFNNRAKLYRFVDGEWKEKGLGVMKILEHTQTGSRRIVMRRDQIHKVCCNHRITPDLVIKPMIKSEGKALVWFAVDFSDEEEKVEQLSARFKTAEIAANFQALFEESKEKASTNTSITKDDDEDKGVENEEEDDNEDKEDDKEDEEDDKEDDDDDDDVIIEETIYATEEEVEQARKYMLPDHFYLYKLKKPCPGCIGCDDGDRSVAQKASSSPIQKPIFESTQPSFSSLASGGENIFSEDGKEKSSNVTGFSFSSEKISAEPSFSSLASSGENIFTQFNKDKPSFQSDAPSFSSLASGGENLFTSPFNKDQPAFASNAPTFSTLASASESSFGQTSKGNKPFKWSGAGQKLFNTSGNQDDDDSVHHEAGDDIHFEPIIPLPDLVEVVTGEEDWQIIFTQRSKLYRYDKSTSQWKERGTGDMKVMKHQDKDLYRLLFRREQVFKVVCNHMISSAINMKPMETSDKAWCWVAEDFSEEEGKVENFAVKFKNIELAAKFKETFDGIIATLQEKEASREQDKSLDETVTTDDNDDDNDGDNDHEEHIDVLFDKRVTIFTKVDNNWTKQGTGNLKVALREDVNGNAIDLTTDDGNCVCNHIVCQEYYITLERARKTCMWSAVDFSTGPPIMCEFKAQFSSPASAEEFFTVFRYSLKLAADSELSKISTNVNGED
ncbi:E3 SUMO-protein ligase RanBP2 [Patella vulgata]|uniref:E3 SUMO-protein ligase RanBP2 n=1 Tax=Patella vulgata TaxID=6465 RepID=UPI0021800E86|nr:E3 SUMO-protein ligase RanBP2 [Patella vulgata]